jgi:hypothetical protein
MILIPNLAAYINTQKIKIEPLLEKIFISKEISGSRAFYLYKEGIIIYKR